MSFFAILFALMLEQARPLPRDNPAHDGLKAWAVSVRRSFDDGPAGEPWLTWAIALLVPVAFASGVYLALLHWVGWPLALLWNVAILYLTVGFRQFSHHFTSIRDALADDDDATAHQAFAHWRQMDTLTLTRTELLRHVLAYGIVQAHRHVFGVFFWFTALMLLGLGPAGAVLYRTAEYLSRQWSHHTIAGAAPVSVPLQRVTRQAWTWIDWLPARLTAIGMAMVGSFEDAIVGWRQHASTAPEDNDGIIVAAAAGALHVRLSGPGLQPRADMDFGTPEAPQDSAYTEGQTPEFAHLHSMVGLVWRLVAVWLLLLAVLTVGRLLG